MYTTSLLDGEVAEVWLSIYEHLMLLVNEWLKFAMNGKEEKVLVKMDGSCEKYLGKPCRYSGYLISASEVLYAGSYI